VAVLQVFVHPTDPPKFNTIAAYSGAAISIQVLIDMRSDLGTTFGATSRSVRSDARLSSLKFLNSYAKAGLQMKFLNSYAKAGLQINPRTSALWAMAGSCGMSFKTQVCKEGKT
jgi:hypothetical protein